MKNFYKEANHFNRLAADYFQKEEYGNARLAYRLAASRYRKSGMEYAAVNAEYMARVCQRYAENGRRQRQPR